MNPCAADQELLHQARQLVLAEQNPSVAFLQRRLKLEYAKASELLRMLEGDVVTAPDATGWRALVGSGARSPDAPGCAGAQAAAGQPHRAASKTERAIGAMLGLAIGDAIGTTAEFQARGSFLALQDMVGGGPFQLQAGQWTDDTSMALCLAESLIDHGFDRHDQLNRYLDWWENGYLSSTGQCFDIGATTAAALARYRDTGNTRPGSSDPDEAGNGCIMRLAPVVLYFQDSPEQAIHHAAEQSKATHRAPECLMACQLMAETLLRALQGKPKDEVLAPSALNLEWTPGLRAIAQGQYRSKTADEIQGTGYVVRSLEAALWCFARTHSYADCVLAAANLGDDADTTAAVAGQIAGAYYGVEAIPQAWRERVHMAAEIAYIALALVAPR